MKEKRYQITQEQNISQVDLAKKIGKSRAWVDKRVRLALNLTDKVVNALETDKITMTVAEIIGTLKDDLQDQFLSYLLNNNIARNETDARKAKKCFLNTTIYTIGYEGKEISEFIDILKKNNIEYLLDVRFSTESPYKPEFRTLPESLPISFFITSIYRPTRERVFEIVFPFRGQNNHFLISFTLSFSPIR